MNIYEQDFVHCASKISISYDKLSRNDRRFLDLMDQKSVKVDEHYELHLPLKDEDIRLPIDRAATMKLLESLRKNFKKDDRFLQRIHEFYGRTEGEGI